MNDLQRELINFLKTRSKTPIEIQFLNFVNDLYSNKISQIESLMLSGQCSEATAKLAIFKADLSRHFTEQVDKVKLLLLAEAELKELRTLLSHWTVLTKETIQN